MTFYLLWLHLFVLDLGFWPFTLGYQMHIILGLTLQAMSYTKKAVFSRLENLWRWNLQNHLQSLRLAPKGTLRYSKENKIHINVWVFRNLQVGLYLWHRVTVGLNLIFSVFCKVFAKSLVTLRLQVKRGKWETVAYSIDWKDEFSTIITKIYYNGWVWKLFRVEQFIDSERLKLSLVCD